MDDNTTIGNMDTNELQTAVVALINEWDPEAVVGVDYRVLTTDDAQAYIGGWPNCTVSDIANELTLSGYDDEQDDDGEAYEYDGQPDEAQEWYDFDPDC
jgi:hypothetical protein